MTESPSPPRASFPAASHDDWRARVAQELGKSGVERTLTAHLPSGLEVRPLYSPPADGVDDPAGFPGLWPAMRGAVPLGRRHGWEVVPPGEAPTRHDPLGDLARDGALPAGLDAALEALATDDRPLGVSTVPHHDAGATAVQELGFALATGVEYLRRLEAAGVDAATGAARIAFRFAVDRDVFANIAKLRAARALWSRVLSACGVETPPPARIHAVTSARTLSRRDPWTNILRVTTQTFAAICGGADAITTAPFDAALGVPSSRGTRLAVNTQTILAEESHIGRVVDPAGGSWYVEELTERLARAAWDELRSLEAAGGMTRALLDGEVRRRIDASWDERHADLARRRLPVTGVSEFADTDELLARDVPPEPSVEGERLVEPLPVRRDAAPFEALRDAADALSPRPTVHLATLGPVAEHSARAIFARNLFQAGGFRVVQEEDGTDTADPAAAARIVAARFVASGAAIACLCGSDARYPDVVPAVAKALGEADARTVLLAGTGGEHEGAYRAAGVGGFVHLGMDVLGLLTGLLQGCGAAAAGGAE